MKLTPVLIVETIEASLPFWVDRMGFEKTVEVPEGEAIGFVILARNGAELMLQSVSSVRKDVPEFAPNDKGNNSALFIEVDDFAETLKRLEGYAIALPQRDTFYGMREIGVLDPAGNTVIFAARVG
jgi:catechol 2,3-dioxygenase-like lactoylglutathione lyase family enzyme